MQDAIRSILRMQICWLRDRYDKGIKAFGIN